MKERFTKLIDTIIELDKGDHSLTDKQWMKKQKWIFALKLFWVIVLVATFLLAINSTDKTVSTIRRRLP